MTKEKRKDTFGADLKRIRLERKLSVPQLEEILKIPKDRIYKWEKGLNGPKWEDRQIIEAWMVNSDWRNSPDAEVLRVMEEPQSSYTISSLLENSKTLIENNRVLSEANKTLSDAHYILAKGHEEVIQLAKMAIAGAQSQSQGDVVSKLPLLLVALAEIGSGTKKWKSVDEGLAALHKQFADTPPVGHVAGTPQHSGKASR